MSKSSLVILSRKAYFSAGVRYFNFTWTEDQNQKVFGDSCSEYGHGYNFILEARLAGHRDPKTSLVVNLTDVEEDLKEVVALLNKKHLGYEVDFFKVRVPTVENIAEYCFIELKKRLGSLLVGVRLRQGEDDWVDIL
ncbi:MAG: 6-carboxytetrahydropterin synthase [Bdellovibrionales bacterium]|nr:6-carboxytetrahydropterin synthase [Bdellovibrionales bacterium]